MYEQLLEVYKESSPSKRILKFWADEFKCDRTSLEDDPREGRPKTATTPEIIEQVHNIVNEAPNLTKREVSNILYGELHMKKLFGKLVPHTLTI